MGNHLLECQFAESLRLQQPGLHSLGMCPLGSKGWLQLVMQPLPSGDIIAKLPHTHTHTHTQVSWVISAFRRFTYWVINSVTRTSFNKHVQSCHVFIFQCSSSLYPWECTRLKHVQTARVVVPRNPRGFGSRTPADTKVQKCWNALHKMVQYWHKTYTHLPYTSGHF